MRRVPEVSELTLRRELCIPQPGPVCIRTSLVNGTRPPQSPSRLQGTCQRAHSPLPTISRPPGHHRMAPQATSGACVLGLLPCGQEPGRSEAQGGGEPAAALHWGRDPQGPGPAAFQLPFPVMDSCVLRPVPAGSLLQPLALPLCCRFAPCPSAPAPVHPYPSHIHASAWPRPTPQPRPISSQDTPP